MMFNACLMEYYREMKLPFHEMREKSLSMCNEEAGEQSFGVLGRSALGDTQKKKLDVMNNHYRNIADHRKIDDALREQRQHPDTKTKVSWRKEYTKDNEDVKEVVSFLKNQIRRRKIGKLLVLDGSAESYADAEGGIEHSVQWIRQHPTWQPELESLEMFDFQQKRLCKFVGTVFGQGLADVWPEMVHDGETDAEEEEAPVESDADNNVPLSELAAAQKEVLYGNESSGQSEDDNSGTDTSTQSQDGQRKRRSQSTVSASDEEDESSADQSVTTTPANKKFHSGFADIGNANILASGRKRKRRRIPAAPSDSDQASESDIK